MKRTGTFLTMMRGQSQLLRFRMPASSFLRVTTNQFEIAGAGMTRGSVFAGLEPEFMDWTELERLSSIISQLSYPSATSGLPTCNYMKLAVDRFVSA